MPDDQDGAYDLRDGVLQRPIQPAVNEEAAKRNRFVREENQKTAMSSAIREHLVGERLGHGAVRGERLRR
jgi:hypothetical protein